MTALENVAVPLELAGEADAFDRAAAELASVGLRERVNHYPAELSGGEQQRVALARALAPHPAILVADEPTGNLDEATGREIIELLFAGHETRNTTLVLVTHDTALAQRCDRVVRLRSGASNELRVTAQRERRTRDSPGASRCARCAAACAALRCSSPASRSASPAIAGVGSFARSLGDGLAREGRIILGGDASFSLMAREASAPERKFLDDNGRVSVAATMRAMARTADGQTALVELKAVDGTYPLYGDGRARPCEPPRRRVGGARRRIRRGGRSGAARAAQHRTRRTGDTWRRHDRASRNPEIRTRQARRRHRLRPAPAHQRGGAARDRPDPARQPGALALPPAPPRGGSQ